MRYRTTLPLEIGGVKMPAGTPLDVSPEDGEAMVAAGRAAREPDDAPAHESQES